MGLPKERVFELMFPPLKCYHTMIDHTTEFSERWFFESLAAGNEDYLLSRKVSVKEVDILKSFDYVKSLPRDPSPEHMLDLAKNVLEGCLVYSASDTCLEGDFTMEDFARHIMKKFTS